MKENLGSEFAGLQQFIMSQIDSPGDNSVQDFSSFSNSSDSSDYSNEEVNDLSLPLMPSHPNARLLQTSKPLQKQPRKENVKSALTKDLFAAFVTESPFSFKNPIFFSASHKTTNEYTRKKFTVKQSKR